MKPIKTKTVQMCYHVNGILSSLDLEIEYYKTVAHAHIVDHRKYFPLVLTVKHSLYKGIKESDIVDFMYKLAIRHNYFN